MRPRLLYPEQDAEWVWIEVAVAAKNAQKSGWVYRNEKFDPHKDFPWNAETLDQDLELTSLFTLMSRDDPWIFAATQRTVLLSTDPDLDHVFYRQEVLRDCLQNAERVRTLYALACEAHEREKDSYLSSFNRHPETVLRESVRKLSNLLGVMRRLNQFASEGTENFSSRGWSQFLEAVKKDLDTSYIDALEAELKLFQKHDDEVLVSAALGKANRGMDYVLHRLPFAGPAWWSKILTSLSRWGSSYGFDVDPRDQGGVRAITNLRGQGVLIAAESLGRAAQHVHGFFSALRSELAFFVGCLNLADLLESAGKPICLPAASSDPGSFTYRGLYEPHLVPTLGSRVVGNDANAQDRPLLVVTGANTGGKSTLLRALGIAQLMMQAGMFVAAEAFASPLCNGIFTHFRKEEDSKMKQGKFEEELTRMDEIVDHLSAGSLVLLNESFASTNEREGAAIAQDIITAFLERKVRVVCVTHLFELSHGLFNSHQESGFFLRAARGDHGIRTFKLQPGEPLQTSYAVDVYRRVFGSPATTEKTAV